MAEIEDFSRIVSTLNALAGQPDSWDPVLGDIADCLEATAATMITDTAAARTVLATTITPEAATVYQDYYYKLDFVAKAFESGPVGLVADGWELGQRHLGTEYYNDWQKRYEMTDGMFVRLAAPVPTSLAISAPPRDEPFATTERLRFLNALVPHLNHALHTRALLTDADQQLVDIGVAANLIRHGIVVVGPGGRVTAMNTAAQRITSTDDGLRRRGEFIEASATTDNHHLQAAIARAVRPQPPAPRVGSHLICGRRTGGRPYVLRVTPLDTHDDPRLARAAIIVVDLKLEPQPPEALLRNLFELSPAETTVALQLIGGDSLSGIADRLALSLATVKTHVQRIFRKTGTRRQTELLRLLLALDTST